MIATTLIPAAQLASIIKRIKTDNINDVFIDLFCGAGGVTEAVERKRKAIVIACINHWPVAITSHRKNHPDALHYEEDIKTADIGPIVWLVNHLRELFPGIKVHLWASLECTNHSIAKGGMSRDADSRTLAEHLYRYIEALRPDKIWIENVKEFRMWGPLQIKVKPAKGIDGECCPLEWKTDKKTKLKTCLPVWVPIKEQKGVDYKRWVDSVKTYGYNYQYRLLNAADYGARTSRIRYFAQFSSGLPTEWPKATHSKKPIEGSGLKKWLPVRPLLQLDVQGQSIFGRKRKDGTIANLSENTYKRLYGGLIKEVAGGKDAFLIKWNSLNKNGDYVSPSVDEPCPTVATQNRLGVANCHFLSKYYSGNPDNKSVSVEGPAGSITCIDHHALVSADFIATYHGNGDNTHSLNGPAPTIAGADINALVQPQFIYRDFSGGGSHGSLKQPAGSVTGTPKMNLVSATPFLMDTQFGNGCKSIDQPSPTQTANRKHFYLINPQYGFQTRDIDKPCFTLIARMDKAPPCLIFTEHGQPAISIEPTDTKHMILIKEFMALYGIVDIMMRMLLDDELLQIQGFPIDYFLAGTQGDRKKQIGNSVQVDCVDALVSCNISNYPNTLSHEAQHQ